MNHLAWLLAHEVIVGCAVLGGVASLIAMGLQARGPVNPVWISRLHRLAYLFMGVSILLFIVRGLVHPQPA